MGNSDKEHCTPIHCALLAMAANVGWWQRNIYMRSLCCFCASTGSIGKSREPWFPLPHPQLDLLIPNRYITYRQQSNVLGSVSSIIYCTSSLRSPPVFNPWFVALHIIIIFDRVALFYTSISCKLDFYADDILLYSVIECILHLCMRFVLDNEQHNNDN